MRLFFALELPAQVTVQIADWRDRQFGPVGRPVPAANFHITLAFIGELADDSLERLCLAVDSWLPGCAVPGAELRLECTGYWPRPGIYWLGPEVWPESLVRLATKLRQLATAAGAKRDRNPFRPHITLFRNCSAAPAVSTPAIALPYQHFSLYQSRQGKSGVSYQAVHHWELQVAKD